MATSRTLAAMPRPNAVSLVALLVIALVAAGCVGDEAASFDPSSPCVTDGAAPGAYPELEALIPTTFEDQAPETLDSGRNCTPENLANLADAGIDEVRYAGGTWSFGGRRAAALVVFTAPGLTAELLATFYGTSAQTANRTVVTGTSTPTLAGRPGFRIDTETGDRLQTVLVWPSAERDRVNVVISTDLPDPKLLAGVDALEAAAST
jgi:hypothetical protein